MKGCVCLNRRTTQVSQTRRWVFSIDYTDGDRTAPKLDGVTKYFQQDEGEFYPHTIWPLCNRFHIVTVVSVEEELTWIWKTPMVWVNGISDYPPNILRVEVMFILRNVSLIGYASGVTGLKMDMLFPVVGSVCPEITTSRHSTQDFPLGYFLKST